jgi:23S rRNA (cytidine1920-2'-O)/16S rRNA (cytidine1409-2'-O)-methyltransferase
LNDCICGDHRYRKPVADHKEIPFVSRAGFKLDHALHQFTFDVNGMVCVDFGCNVGGFTDCLLQRGAVKVFAIDTGYGVLAWKLRNDPRVIVMERTNALHAQPAEQVDLVVIDMAWTPQRHAIPVALQWLKPGGKIITLIKPHYELEEDEKRTLLVDGRLAPTEAERIMQRVIDEMPKWGARVIAHTKSPITGGKSSKAGEGNVEFLAFLDAD